MIVEIKQTQVNGLDRLVRLVERGTQVLHLDPWLDSAYAQLEMDDILDAQTTDKIADLLSQAEEVLAAGSSPQQTLQEVARLYTAATNPTVEEKWRFKASEMPRFQLETETWLNFQSAVKGAQSGLGESVLHWVDQMEDFYFEAWSKYEQLNLVEEEICQESILGHLFLKEGMELWLEALDSLRDYAQSQQVEVLAELWDAAEAGQRLLLTVQLAEREQRRNQELFRACWN